MSQTDAARNDASTDALARLDARLNARIEAAEAHDHASVLRDASLDDANLDEANLDGANLDGDSRALVALFEALDADRIPVRDGFTDSVCAALPEPAWRCRGGLAWRLPVAALVAFALGAALLLAGQPTGPLGGTGSTLADFAQSTLLAGAGLLGASWRGIGLGLHELFAASTGSLIAAAVAVLCLDLLFVSLLRRRKAPVEATAVRRSDEDAEGASS